MNHKRLIVCFVLVVTWVVTGIALSATKKPATVAELALYKGTDRQQMLEEGAKKEGKVIFYTTGTQAKHLVAAFEKKYPFIKVEEWRSDDNKLLSRTVEEYKAGRHVVDVIGPTQIAEVVLREAGMLQPFYSPELSFMEEGVSKKAPGGGVISTGHFQSGMGLGYNTKLIKKDMLPQSYQDLLNPKWKGRWAIVGSSSGVHWVGALLAAYGEEFVKKMAEQQIQVHMVSGRALNDMIINGEYTFSPTIFDSHVGASQTKGAPIDWIPLEPVASYLGQIMLPKYAAHPHAAMLYIDFDLSKEAGEIYKTEGYNSPRKDVANLRDYKKYFGFESTEEVARVNRLFDKLFLKK